MDDFSLEGLNHANGNNFRYYNFLCCCDCVLASNIEIASSKFQQTLDMIQCDINVSVGLGKYSFLMAILPPLKASGYPRQGPSDFMDPVDLTNMK